MTNNVLELNSFFLSSQTNPSDIPRCLLAPGSNLILPKPGIYTLEGDNQAGKSTLLKVIMGVIALEGKEPPVLNLLGKQITVKSVTDARAAGLAAVFQDDPLIPSLTIAEQLVLLYASKPVEEFLSLFKDAKDRQTQLNAKSILVKADKLLRTYGDGYSTVLDKYPTQLSGTALAVAKIVKAQLQRPLQVLFLDEVFAGVQRDVWPLLLEHLKEWNEASKTTLVAITNNNEEISYWQPIGRLIIREHRIDMITDKPDKRTTSSS